MHFPLSSCKNLPPTFSMVHLLHRLYGVDAPAYRIYINHYRSPPERQKLFSHFSLNYGLWECREEKVIIP